MYRNEGSRTIAPRDILLPSEITESGWARGRCVDRFPPRTPEAGPSYFPKTRTRVALSTHHSASNPRSTNMGCGVSFSEAHKKYLQGLIGGVYISQLKYFSTPSLS